MAVILNIETATRNCSVSLATQGKALATCEYAGANYIHAEKLHLFIDAVLKEAQVPITDIDAIAVSRGPGSYTGLRIGVAAAKGLCYGLGKPLIAIDTLTVLAQQAVITTGFVIPMLDARRMEVYSAMFTPQLEQVSPVVAEIINQESYAEYDQPLYFLGDGQQKVQTVINRPNCHFLVDAQFPSSRDMAAISFKKYGQGAFEDVAYFEPFYLKDFLAGPK